MSLELSLDRADGVTGSVPQPRSRPIRSTTFMAGQGNQLREARTAAGLTLREFAGRLAVSTACASRWETDVRRPHSTDIVRIATVIARPIHEVTDWFAAPPLSTEAIRDARGLRKLRVNARMSRAQLGVAVGVSSATIAHWECGRRALPAARWPALAAALDVDVVDLVSTARAGAPPLMVTPLIVLRRRRGLTQRQVAARLGVTGSLVSRWERGICVPGWPDTRRLAMLLGVPVAVVGSAVGRRPPVELDRTRWRRGGLGPVLRELRMWRGESRATVSLRVGVHPQTVRRWETGSTTPTSDQIRRLELALGLPELSLPR